MLYRRRLDPGVRADAKAAPRRTRVPVRTESAPIRSNVLGGFSKSIGTESSRSRRSKCIESFGSSVAAQFPSANTEIEEAGNCIAPGRNTAAAFHLMRVMEISVNAVEKSLEKDAPKKAGNFFSNATHHIRSLKDDYRDPAIHVEKTYNGTGAMRVMTASREFMEMISSRLDERGQICPLFPPARDSSPSSDASTLNPL